MDEPRRILIADDDRELCMEIAEILRDEGYRTDTAFDGKSALGLIESGQYNLCILDIKMPHLNGLDILKEVKEKKPGIFVVIATGSLDADRFLKKEFAGSGFSASGNEDLRLADAVFVKPFDVERLLDRIRSLLN